MDLLGVSDFKNKMGNSRKNPSRCLVEGGHIFFEKETLEFLDLSLY